MSLQPRGQSHGFRGFHDDERCRIQLLAPGSSGKKEAGYGNQDGATASKILRIREEAEIREQFSNELEECSHELEVSREGAAMVLCWFGLAGLDEDVDGLIWRACGRLTSPAPSGLTQQRPNAGDDRRCDAKQEPSSVPIPRLFA